MKGLKHYSICFNCWQLDVCYGCDTSNIAFLMGVVDMYMENSNTQHWEVVKSIMRYLHLKAIKDLCICFGKHMALLFASWKLTMLVIWFVECSPLGVCLPLKSISQISELQKCVALSTTKAKCVVAMRHTRRIYGFHGLVRDLVITKLHNPHCDYQSAIMQGWNIVFHEDKAHTSQVSIHQSHAW